MTDVSVKLAAMIAGQGAVALAKGDRKLGIVDAGLTSSQRSVGSLLLPGWGVMPALICRCLPWRTRLSRAR